MDDKELIYVDKKVSGWTNKSKEEIDKIFNFCDGYISFMNKSKTERETVVSIISILKSNGFVDINEVSSLKSGDKVYYINKDKSIYAAIIGSSSIIDGINIIGSHIDSPRIDLKPNPIYESGKLSLFKTHYYGGIKKYQWTAIPLSLHGVIVKANGDRIDFNIGEEENDPIFTITDLLPHLASEQMKKNLSEAIEGEALNIVIGSIPNDDDSIKNNILKLLYDKYNIIEKDFNSAEIEIVPAFKAKSLGFDKSMVAAYGQDDRVCAYSEVMALVNANVIDRTVVGIFADKEEIGSIGNTGMRSEQFDYFVALLVEKSNSVTFNALNKIYCRSRMISADVGAGVDPNYTSVSDKDNASYIGYGFDVSKYTGSRGKSGGSDANAEFVAFVRRIFEENDVKYQISELGKVDKGGGGTIAYILADKGVEVLDCGVPVISMHSPYEVTSKFDIYNAFVGYKAFFEEK